MKIESTATATKTKTIKATGNCFHDAFHLLLKMGGSARLVHGIVYHSAVGWHSHGWVEDHLFCYDFVDGKLCVFPKFQYYATGKIKTGAREIFRYSPQEAINKSIRTKKYYFSNLPVNQ